ncbi:MAG TPA: Maf family protein [Rhizomicrobium sp.]|jgi:septum formation protein
MTALILASASTIRARLLADAGVPFEAMPARVDEDAVKDSLHDPAAVAETLAEMKALRVSASHPGSLVLGADQVLAFEDTVVSKSDTLAEARALLLRLRGKEHRLIGGAVLARDGAPVWRHVGIAKLWLRDFSEAFLDDYLARDGEAALSSVGCYRLEGLGVQLFSRIEGDYFSILGLPLLPLLAALREQGVVLK